MQVAVITLYLSERLLWLLVLPVVKQFTAPILGYQVSNGSLPGISQSTWEGKQYSSQVGWQSCLLSKLTAKSKVCGYWMALKRVSTFQSGWLVCSCQPHVECWFVNLYLLMVNIYFKGENPCEYHDLIDNHKCSIVNVSHEIFNFIRQL